MKRQTPMPPQDIEQLLQRFQDGTTTLQEEQLLAEFFRTHKVKDEWKAFQTMFSLFDNGKVNIEEEEKKHIAWWKYASIAAAITLLLTLGIHFGSRNDEKPVLIAKVDTTTTVPQTEKQPETQPETKKAEEQSQKEQPQQEKKSTPAKPDSVNKVKEIHRLTRPPKYYMAKAETTKPQPETTIETAEVQNVPNNNSVKTEVKTAATAPPLVEKELYSESAIFIRNVPTLPDYEEMKYEIMLRGERLSQLIDTTFNFNININDNIAQNEEVDW